MGAHDCEDCGENDDFQRRTRCPQCDLFICWFCRKSFHKPAIEAGRPCRTQKPSTVSAPDDERYAASGR